MKSSVKYTFMWGFEFIIIVFLAFSTGFYAKNKLREAQDAVSHTRNVVSTIDGCLIDLLNMETGVRGYIISGDKDYLGPYYKGMAEFDKDIDNLRDFTNANPVQQAYIEKLVIVADHKKKFLDHKMAIFNSSTFFVNVEKVRELLIYHKEGKRFMDDARDIISKMRQEEVNRLEQRHLQNTSEINSMLYIIPIVNILNFVVLVLSYYTIREQEKLQRG
jgi:CHASE3 domain sensor protein